MTLFFYNIALIISKWIIGFFKFKPKVKSWIEGQNQCFDYLSSQNIKSQHVIWIHCASTGEFEQGRPIIEQLKLKFPNQKILLTFFSSTAYKSFQKYDKADFICYLPFDTQKNVKRFIELTQPRFAIFVKYEFWWNYLNELKDRKIPFYYTSFITRENQYFWKIPTFKTILKSCSHFFVQNEESAIILEQKGILNYSITGDCRVDRVLEIVEKEYKNPIIEAFKGDSQLLIVGSAWEKEKELIFALLTKLPNNWKVVIAPHELKENQLKEWQLSCPAKMLRYTQFQTDEDAKCLLFDTIGHLALSYRYGKIAFIGGGFGDGIHNILEPLAYGLPVLFGPNFQKFQEAKDVLHLGCGKTILDSLSFEHQVFEWINNPDSQNIASEKAKRYIQQNKGATKKIISLLTHFL